MAYDKNKDYAALMEESAAKGDYASAAKYEQLRNEKIVGEGMSAATTNKYAGYLNGDSPTAGTNVNAAPVVSDSPNYEPAGAAQSGVSSVDMEAPALQEAATQLTAGQNTSGKQTIWANNNSGDAIDRLLDQILNRGEFSYDAESDPIYQQYAQQYQREGDRAMNDTLAAAAAHAGGMNSYAVTAAQQASDYYAAQLGDKIPELYQLAYQMYMDDIDLQVQDLGIVRENRESARAELDAILAAGGTPSDALIAASGYSPEYIAAMQAFYAPKSGGGSYYYDPDDIDLNRVVGTPQPKNTVEGMGDVDAETALDLVNKGLVEITGMDHSGNITYKPTAAYTEAVKKGQNDKIAGIKYRS